MDLERNGRFQQIKPLRCDGREYLKPKSADLKKNDAHMIAGVCLWVSKVGQRAALTALVTHSSTHPSTQPGSESAGQQLKQ